MAQINDHCQLDCMWNDGTTDRIRFLSKESIVRYEKEIRHNERLHKRGLDLQSTLEPAAKIVEFLFQFLDFSKMHYLHFRFHTRFFLFSCLLLFLFFTIFRTW